MADNLTKDYIPLIISDLHASVSGRSNLTNFVLYSDYLSGALSQYKQVHSI